MSQPIPALAETAGGRATVAPLPDWGVLTFEGADAAAFLHAQLSSDVAGMPTGGVGWSSYNSPKGRMLGSLLLWRRAPDAFAAFVAADLAEPLRKRLSMFVLRSKVAVADATPAGTLFGIAGAGARSAVAKALDSDPEPGTGAATDDAWVIALRDGRRLVRAPAAQAGAVRSRLAAHATEAAAAEWHVEQVRAGIAVITRATQDLFVPQTANWDLIGGLDFKKGCYPGQEIVARMQYLGRLKERLFAFHVDGDVPAAATPVFSPAFGDQACGSVVNGAPAPGGGADLLVVAQWSAAVGGPLHIGAPDGPLLAPRPLPYDVPAPVAPNRPKL